MVDISALLLLGDLVLVELADLGEEGLDISLGLIPELVTEYQGEQRSECDEGDGRHLGSPCVHVCVYVGVCAPVGTRKVLLLE